MTVTQVAGHTIYAGSIVQAGIGKAVVHVCLASIAGESRQAGAIVVSDSIQAGSSVETRLVPAFVPVGFTIVPSVTVLTKAPVQDVRLSVPKVSL